MGKLKVLFAFCQCIKRHGPLTTDSFIQQLVYVFFCSSNVCQERRDSSVATSTLVSTVSYQSYTTSCGLFGWARCRRSRLIIFTEAPKETNKFSTQGLSEPFFYFFFFGNSICDFLFSLSLLVIFCLIKICTPLKLSGSSLPAPSNLSSTLSRHGVSLHSEIQISTSKMKPYKQKETEKMPGVTYDERESHLVQNKKSVHK